MKKKNTAANNILKSIAKGHPLKALSDRDALIVAMLFDNADLVNVALKHKRKYPEAYRAACYVSAIKQNTELMNISVAADTFIDGLDALLTASRRNLDLAACLCPVFYNMLTTGNQYGISAALLDEVQQVIDAIGQHFGFTLAWVGTRWLAQIPYSTESAS